MGTYAASSDVAERLPYRTIDANSKPTTTAVGKWIDQAEAELTGVLDSAQITTPVTNANGINIILSWVAEYVTGLAEKAYARGGGDGDNDSGEDAIERWDALLIAIAENPSLTNKKLWGGATSTSTTKFRSHRTKNYSKDDLAPIFEKDDQEDQF